MRKGLDVPSMVVGAVLLMVGAMLGTLASADTPDSAPVRARQEWVIGGAYAAWQVMNACDTGPEECHRMLEITNAELRKDGLRIFEDGTISSL